MPIYYSVPKFPTDESQCFIVFVQKSEKRELELLFDRHSLSCKYIKSLSVFSSSISIIPRSVVRTEEVCWFWVGVVKVDSEVSQNPAPEVRRHGGVSCNFNIIRPRRSMGAWS
jgi:hypothetical protein